MNLEEKFMKENKYQCVLCKNIYMKEDNDEWNDKKAEKEFNENFKGYNLENIEIVCDNCYKKILKRRNKLI